MFDWWRRASGDPDIAILARAMMAKVRHAQRIGELDYDPAGLVLEAGAYRHHRRLRTALVQATGHESVEEARTEIAPREMLAHVIAECAGNAAADLQEQLDNVADDRFPILVAQKAGGFELRDFPRD